MECFVTSFKSAKVNFVPFRDGFALDAKVFNAVSLGVDLILEIKFDNKGWNLFFGSFGFFIHFIRYDFDIRFCHLGLFAFHIL